MKTFWVSLLTSLVVVLIGFHFQQSSESSSPVAESVYARIMRTKELRCGWFSEPPFINLDPNTNEKTGIVVEIVKQVAKDYDLRVSWETISNFAMMGEDLKQGKYDVICASLINMPRGGLIDSVRPFVYVPAYGYIRNDEARLTALEQLNDPAYRIAGQEGAAVLQVAQQKFPKAQFHIIPSAELSEMLTSVVAGKADVAFMIPTFFEQFLQNNPGRLKRLDATPLQMFTFAFGVKPEEGGLKSLIDNTLERMVASGDLAQIFKTFDPQGNLVYPVLSVSRN